MTTLGGADQNGHAPARPVGHRSGIGGAWCGLGLALLWAPMAAVIPLFPDLDDRGEVVSFWQDHGADVPHFSNLIWPPTRLARFGRFVLAAG